MPCSIRGNVMMNVINRMKVRSINGVRLISLILFNDVNDVCLATSQIPTPAKPEPDNSSPGIHCFPESQELKGEKTLLLFLVEPRNVRHQLLREVIQLDTELSDSITQEVVAY